MFGSTMIPWNSTEDFYFWMWLLITASSLGTLFVVFFKRKLTTPFRKFLGILSIAVLCSFLPYGPLSMILGFPAALLASIFVTLLLVDKEPK